MPCFFSVVTVLYLKILSLAVIFLLRLPVKVISSWWLNVHQKAPKSFFAICVTIFTQERIVWWFPRLFSESKTSIVPTISEKQDIGGCGTPAPCFDYVPGNTCPKGSSSCSSEHDALGAWEALIISVQIQTFSLRISGRFCNSSFTSTNLPLIQLINSK